MISPGCHVIPLPKEESILWVTVPFRDTRNDCLSRDLEDCLLQKKRK